MSQDRTFRFHLCLRLSWPGLADLENTSAEDFWHVEGDYRDHHDINLPTIYIFASLLRDHTKVRLGSFIHPGFFLLMDLTCDQAFCLHDKTVPLPK